MVGYHKISYLSSGFANSLIDLSVGCYQLFIERVSRAN